MSARHAAGITLVVVALASRCASGPPAPARPGPEEACRFCRMTIAESRLVSQLVAPREDAMFFDDLGCLRAFLEGQPRLASGTVTYVTDHRTGQWVRADLALYTRHDAIATPMGSHVVAHESPASRDADPATAGGRPVPFENMFPVRPR